MIIMIMQSSSPLARTPIMFLIAICVNKERLLLRMAVTVHIPVKLDIIVVIACCSAALLMIKR